MTTSAFCVAACAATAACSYPALPAIPTACVAPYTSVQYASAQDGSTLHGCYRLETKPTPWLDAEQDCEGDAPDAHLVVIDSVDEHYAIHTFSMSPRTNDVWIGYTDLALDGTMRWPAPGGLEPERPPNPNLCFFGMQVNPAGATCVTQMTVNTCGDWFYRSCTELHAYVCERDGSPANSTAY